VGDVAERSTGMWVQLNLAPTPDAAAEVRRRLRAAARGSAFESRLEDAELAATELVTNAVLHGRQPIRVTIRLDEERLRVEVADASPVSPTFSLLDPTAVTGRGLLLVASVADHWGVEPDAEGKVVWMELSSHAPSAAEEADVEALLESWADELPSDPAYEQVRVVLTDLDTTLLAASEVHNDGVLRELALMAYDDEAASRLRQTATQILQATTAFEPVHSELKRQLAVAVAHGRPLVDIELRITRHDAELVRDYSHGLDAAQRLCSFGELLHEPPPAEVADIRREYLRRILAQLSI
jgi:anti-sigma regulatory factor (Ser/Thr protein kinase)